MSFCRELKQELLAVKAGRCCRVAEGYGLLLFGHDFSFRRLSFVTGDKQAADAYAAVLKTQFAILPAQKTTGQTRKQYHISVEDVSLCRRVLEAFGYTENDRLSINTDVFKRDCCFGSFVRGVFLACGQMSDPYKNYHAEFVIRDLTLALNFYTLLCERGLSPRRSMRGTTTVIYFNRSETVEELLTLMGCHGKFFELIDVQIAKTIRNSENRRMNLDMGNLSKQVSAAVAQQAAIDRLEKSGRLGRLDRELQQAAALRRAYPEASLGELCRQSPQPLTRSGLNHRLQRLVRLAAEEAAERQEE